MNRASHVVKAHKICSPEHGKNDCANEGSNETFHGLFGWQLDERGTANRNTPDVGEAVVTNNKGCRNPEPDKAFKDVIDDEMAKVN